jgi:hypothetical protein
MITTAPSSSRVAPHPRTARQAIQGADRSRALEAVVRPAPLHDPLAKLDVRPGATSRIVMRDPEGHEFPTISRLSRMSGSS